MQIEFKLMLRRALYDVREELSSRMDRELSEQECGSIGIEISRPPASSGGAVCSSAPFAAAALCNGICGKTLWHPSEIAERMILAVRQQGGRTEPYFRLFVGGPGHINADIEPDFGPALLDHLVRGELFALFQEPSLFEAVSDSDQRTERQLSEYRSRLSGWGLSRFGSTLGAEPGFEPLASRAKDGDSAARLQLLAMAADEELDSSAFLAGIGGKENVPWYLARFLRDSDSFIQSAADASSASAGRFDVPLWFGPAMEVVLHARFEFLRAYDANSPERLLKHILSAIHSFYRYFNHPRVRSWDIGEEAIPLAGKLTRALSRIVRQGAVSLDFPCDSKDFVLRN